MSEWVTASTPYLAPRPAGEPDPWEEEAARAGHVGRHRLTLVAWRPAPREVAMRLGIEPGASTVLRRRLVSLDDRPVEIADSWYPSSIAAGTALAERKPIRGGAVRLLAELGYVGVRHVEDIGVVDPPVDVAPLLGTAPVLELTRTSYTSTDTPYEVAIMFMSREMVPGETRRLRYELRSE